MSRRPSRLQQAELWTARLRTAAVALGVVEVGLLHHPYPDRYEAAAWLVTICFAVGAIVLLLACLIVSSRRGFRILGANALAFDAAVAYAYMWVFAFEPGVVSWGLVYLPVIEAAVRYGLRGGMGAAAASVPLLVGVEWWRSSRFIEGGFDADVVVLPAALALFTGLVVGSLVDRLAAEGRKAVVRAREAEALRDELGRRANLVDAANRCARALGASLVLEEAFAGFMTQLEQVVPSDRVTIWLHEGGTAHVMATAGLGADEVLPAGTTLAVEGTLLEELIAKGEPVYRERLEESRYPAEAPFVRLGLGCRLAAPLTAGAETIGMLSLARRQPASFSPVDVELIGLLGRLVGSAVQNIRAYEAERARAEELRQLSAMRSDFVSMVSHELRSPMATVVGSARTLHDRWDDLTHEQRATFLALIADETGRLAVLVAHVLDASRIEAGTFTYAFRQVAVDELVRTATAAAAAAAHDGVAIHLQVDGSLPQVQGDVDRLRQVLGNLLENAIKYSPHGERVLVRARADDAHVRVDVEDRGPGIPEDQQALIFEKFGRATQHGEHTHHGTGLGLYIARSIAETHGGTLQVRSTPGKGATFTLSLPVGE